MQFKNGNCDKPASAVASLFTLDEPVSVVSSSFTLQGDRGGSTAVRLSFLWQSFVYMFKKSSEHNWRHSKMVEADAIRQKFQMWLELQILIELQTILSQSQIVAESPWVDGLILRP